MLAVLASLLLCCQEEPKLREGVYSLVKEVAGFSGEVVELKDGKFRYWFFSDVKREGEPAYPLAGAYTVTGRAVTLEHDKIHAKVRTIGQVNGADVLWRDDGLKIWESEQRIHPYGVLVRVEGGTAPPTRAQLPSIEQLKNKEMKDREQRDYEERFNELPPESRALMRAKTDRTDRTLFKQEMAKARENPDPRLVRQLVALTGRESKISIESRMVLGEIYTESFRFKGPPPFLQQPETKAKGLEGLVDALSAAPDRNALEHTVMLFLKASGAGPMRLPIAGTPLEVRLEFRADRAEVYGSEGTPADDINWLKFMPKVIPACQKWMREQLAK
jgi:hypothetical protein